MKKIRILGYLITIEKVGEKQRKAVQQKINTSLQKIAEALERMETRQQKYTEYALQKESGLSINTIRKYRAEIEKIRAEKKGLFE